MLLEWCQISRDCFDLALSSTTMSQWPNCLQLENAPADIMIVLGLFNLAQFAALLSGYGRILLEG